MRMDRLAEKQKNEARETGQARLKEGKLFRLMCDGMRGYDREQSEGAEDLGLEIDT